MGFGRYLRYNRESLGYLSHDLDLSGINEVSMGTAACGEAWQIIQPDAEPALTFALGFDQAVE